MIVTHRKSAHPPVVLSFVALALGLCAACGGDPGFGSTRARSVPVPAAADAIPVANKPLGFRLSPAAGDSIVLPGRVVLDPHLVDLASDSRETARAGGWLVTLVEDGGAVLSTEGGVGAKVVDLSGRRSGDVRVTARFRSRDRKATGTAMTVLRVDADAPETSVIWTRGSGSSDVTVSWEVLDRADYEGRASALVACASADDFRAYSIAEDAPPTKSSVNAAEMNPGPACVVLSEGELEPRGTTALSAAAWEGLGGDPAARVIGAVTADRVGNRGAYHGRYLDRGQVNLVLEVKGAPDFAFTRRPAKLDVSLREVGAGIELELTGDEVEKHELVFVDDKGQTTVVPFARSLVLPDALVAEGRRNLVVSARRTVPPESSPAKKSNEVRLSVAVDTLPPVVTAPSISVDGGLLVKDAQLTVAWQVQEAGRVAGQVVEWRSGSAGAWAPLVPAGPEIRSVTLAWDKTKDKATALQVRVRATDAQGLEGEATGNWFEQFFNAAVLTKSVECFWCHMEIKGHVGGIFPGGPGATPDSHPGAGINFSVWGNFYSNVGFPGGKMSAAIPADNRETNYKNEGLPVFPRDNKWPDLGATDIRPRMNGFIRAFDPIASANVFVDRVHAGNLVLKGTPERPIAFGGEVFVDGDLVILGTYAGLGTIYARNIFIVDDLVARASPFPFPDDEVAALAAAREAVGQRKDGMYLVSFKDIVVGSPESMSKGSCTDETRVFGGVKFTGVTTCPLNVPLESNVVVEGAPSRAISSPYSWLPKSDFQRLGRRARYPEVMAYRRSDPTESKRMAVIVESGHYPDELFLDARGEPRKRAALTNDRTALEVSRVDAFLYATQAVQARVFVNLVINGGVMSPNLELLSTHANSDIGNLEWRLDDRDYRFGTQLGEQPPVNPANGFVLNKNGINYDWRLRTGGAGLVILKEFFR